MNITANNNFRVRNKQKKRKNIILILLFLILTILGIYTYYIYNKAENALKNAHSELKRGNKSNLRGDDVKPYSDNVSILIMGIDTGIARMKNNSDPGRTDSLILATFNRTSKDIKLLSIPRDIYTYVDCIKKNTKVNAAHHFGGVDATIDTVERLLNVPVDYYVKVNFEGFMSVIDAVGGIDVNVPVSFTTQNSKCKSSAITIHKGYQSLNAEQALALSRVRKIDSDFERGKRQMLVIESILKKAISINSIPKAGEIIDTIGKNIDTNLQMTDILSLYKFALNTSDGLPIEKLQVVVDDIWIDRIYYGIAEKQSLIDLSNTMRTHLDLKPEPEYFNKYTLENMKYQSDSIKKEQNKVVTPVKKPVEKTTTPVVKPTKPTTNKPNTNNNNGTTNSNTNNNSGNTNNNNQNSNSGSTENNNSNNGDNTNGTGDTSVNPPPTPPSSNTESN